MTEKQYDNLASKIRKSFKTFSIKKYSYGGDIAAVVRLPLRELFGNYYEVTINVSTVLEYEVCEHGPYIGHGNFKNNTYDNNINAISCEIGKIIALVK